ncbi:MAG TPA: 16S rRNA (guanine(966)-N(2))-methyltransferase RsmD [Actinomycetota bacterium]|nr:16S rRNA (guanine(966)-N(2))-methyltransferase RsmD [Actinomycetota bacterium]
MRVIAGKAKGHRLRAPIQGTRPMTDRIKESLFSSLGDLEDRVVLDLYAGSGSLGLEALSRGARSATFVENAREAILKIEQNIEVCSFGDRSNVEWMEVQSMLGRPAIERHDLIFVDPPYSLSVEAVRRDLEALVMGGWLSDEGRVVVHRMSKDFKLDALGLKVIWERTFGQSTVLVYTHEDEEE